MSEPTKPTDSPSWDTGLVNVAAPDAGHVSGGYVTNEFPASNVVNWLFNVWGRWINWAAAFILIQPGANANSNIAISSNNVTPTAGNHTFTAAGTIHNILQTNMNDGRILLLCGTDSQTNTITNLAGGTGQVQSADGADIVLASSKDSVTLQRQGAKWVEISRTIDVSTAARQLLITLVSSTTTVTVPALTTKARVRQWGGGASGGGGGGSGVSDGGANGTDGGDTWLSSSGNKSRGGKAGAGGISNFNSGAGSAGGAAQIPVFASANFQGGSLAGNYGGDAASPNGGAGGASTQQPNLFAIAQRLGGAGGVGLANGADGTAGQAKTGAGGGGGGGGGNVSIGGGGGGGAGANGEYSEYFLTVTPGASLTATIGAGGTLAFGGAGSGTNGGGGNSGPGGSGFMIIEWIG